MRDIGLRQVSKANQGEVVRENYENHVSVTIVQRYVPQAGLYGRKAENERKRLIWAKQNSIIINERQYYGPMSRN